MQCLAALRDDASDDYFVKVGQFGRERLLYFSDNDACSSSATAAPAEWQTRVTVDGNDIASNYFPPTDDYIGLFVISILLLPHTVLSSGVTHAEENAAATAPRLLILGGGGGALAVLLARILPAAIIDVVEPSKAVLTLAKRYFGLRCAGNTRCHQTHARAYVRRHRGGPRYDFVALDAFENDGEESATPRAWSRREWCAELTAVLDGDHGVLAANLYAADETSMPFRSSCDALRSGGSRVVLEPASHGGSSNWWTRGYAAPSNTHGMAAQTVEAWSLTAQHQHVDMQQAAFVLRQRNPEVAAEVLGARVRLAWRGRVRLGHGGVDATSTEALSRTQSTVSLPPTALAASAAFLAFIMAVAACRARRRRGHGGGRSI